MANARPTASLRRAALSPVSLAAKDGLALISANSATVGHAALVLHDCAASFDALVECVRVRGLRVEEVDEYRPRLAEEGRGATLGAPAEDCLPADARQGFARLIPDDDALFGIDGERGVGQELDDAREPLFCRQRSAGGRRRDSEEPIRTDVRK